ncbi:hypothetical protein BO86DRAFT_324611 [Aspergillus japonicus CBS 114.51]|uniref:Asl1-like glycosyl hydrolase catalytic domain-containing protein n=2 Tax=Aspergillus TaxID=5052 RepID=A0A2V5H6W5_ASPV1|nr:hypothetical protein BO86DRAFT_324611 [Aspergillus japonicus CBS 114.51]PYI19949.1 hypothetical protein BO99DRAFT_402187 [Aspergillus violaceofuscus CBS 115571]RAH76872.1 hypothetical protein BO86DRAFT_324611 [Aspergillus japonicus CBS 114.51]
MVSFTQALLVASSVASTALAMPSHMHANRHTAGVNHPHVTLEHRSINSTSGKRGAAYNSASTVTTLANSGAVTWGYDWNMYSDGHLPAQVEYVPMLWGSKMFGTWFTAIETALNSGSKYILGFNEPDNSGQAAMSSAAAVSAYQHYITPFKGKAHLVTPAVTNGVGADTGLAWAENFLSGCGGSCGVSVLAVHWYGDSAADFKTFVGQAVALAEQYGLQETWVTEFALNSAVSAGQGTQEAAAFLEEVVPWLDAQSGVGRYAYFMCAEGYLLNGDGLSASGKAYIA